MKRNFKLKPSTFRVKSNSNEIIPYTGGVAVLDIGGATTTWDDDVVSVSISGGGLYDPGIVAPTLANYVLGTPHGTLPNAIALSDLNSGLLKTDGSGSLGIATADTDYLTIQSLKKYFII